MLYTLIPITSSGIMDRPFIWGINHLKLATADIRRSQDFYCKIMGMESLPQFDYYNQQAQLISVMVRLKHTEEHATLIELRHDESQALAQFGIDFITFSVRSMESLGKWKSWFERHGVQCSDIQPFQTLKGWTVSATDPDGRIVRIYCDEKHENPVEFDFHNF